MASEPAEERFQMGRLLGTGGMGTVYEAQDLRLQRRVALKLLRSDEPDRITRFLREAQAQARVDHENVCRVYEVGDFGGGRPYIAMQLIAGEPLFVTDEQGSRPGPLLQSMTVEQRVRVLQKVAEAIHAAHREGLVHRDIKPSNVMLERTEADLKPYVLDFGLAREVASAGVSSLGLAAGTPNFMAPEQARGEAGALDRRTDVYGLGATLYAILAGRPPFEGPSSLDVLVKVTEEEPPALDGVPPDLATIVGKCLEKDPARRYESARALAEDLGRYLAGDPIEARRTSLVYRLRTRARKHRRLVVLASVATLAFLVLGVWSLRAQLRAQERTRLAGLFGQEVKAIESQMRIAHLSPEHDITPEKAATRKRMASLEAQIRRIGSVAEGPGFYALGRGHLALGEYVEARETLERAWKAGYREPAVAYGLGQTLGALYQKELEAAARITDKKRREQRTQEIEKEYRDPALDYLQRSRGLEVDSPEYVEALVAFYEKRYDEALQKAGAASARQAWLYEARELEARVHNALGTRQRDQGDKKAAAETYERAEAAYQVALDTGRSDPSVSEGLCRLAASRIQLAVYSGGDDAQPHFQRGLQACQRSIRIDREAVDGYRSLSTLLWRMGESEYRKGQDPRQTLDQTVAACRQVLGLKADDAEAVYGIGVALQLRARYEVEHGGDPTGSLRESIRTFEQALALNASDYRVHMALGNDHVVLGEYLARHGGDPEASYTRAERSFTDAIALRRSFIALSNLGYVHYCRGRVLFEHGEDPKDEIARLREAGGESVKLNPTYVDARANLALADELEAEHEAALGRSPEAGLARAAEVYQALLSENAQDRFALSSMPRNRWLMAAHALRQGRDPRPRTAEGRQWIARLRKLDEHDVSALLTEARLALLDGRWLIGQGGPARTAFAGGLAAVQAALKVEPENAEAHLLAADIHRWSARDAGRPAEERRAAVRAGLLEADRAIAIGRSAEALAVQGALYLEEARLAETGKDALRARARKAFESALSADRLLRHDYEPLLREAGLTLSAG